DSIRHLEAAGCPREWGPNDSLGKALNKPEHRGHVRMMGRRFTQALVIINYHSHNLKII
ncbi:hypothetical protein LINPERPRIM_LOCUS38808, partial [Linum perenne]